MRRCLFTLTLLFATSALANIEPGHFRGTLGGVVYLADNDWVPVEQLSREQLDAEYLRLEQERPGIGGPIAMTSIGAGLLLFGAGFAYSGAVLDAILIFGIGVVMAIGGAVFVTVGLILLFTRIARRPPIDARMDDIKARLETLDRGAMPPPENELPPPPPPPPGAGVFGDVQPGLVLAAF